MGEKKDWQYSDARKIMAQDMIDNVVPIDVKIQNTEDLYYELYAHLPAFKEWPYDRKTFDRRIASLQEIVTRLKWAAQCDRDALAHDRAMHPQPTHAPNGRLLWKGSEADRWLKVDMHSGLHLQMKPEQLRETRDCYKEFSKRRFSKRIDQLKEKAKPFGCTPGQASSKKKKKKNKNNGRVENDPSISRRLILEPYINIDIEPYMDDGEDSDASLSVGSVE